MKRITDNGKHLEIMAAIAKLDTRQSIIETKVDELVRRVGVQNGRVADAESAIKKILGTDSYNAGYSKATSTTWKYIVGVLLAIAAIVVAIIYH